MEQAEIERLEEAVCAAVDRYALIHGPKLLVVVIKGHHSVELALAYSVFRFDLKEKTRLVLVADLIYAPIADEEKVDAIARKARERLPKT